MYIPALTAIQHYTSLTLFWFRRDLRLADNHGLYQALALHERVLPIFIFDTSILSTAPYKPTKVRYAFAMVVP